jgi:tRNA A58 N-methylase Trm61
MRVIQYTAASRFNHLRLWNTGSRAGACHRAAIRPTRWRVTTTEYVISFSRRNAPELCQKFLALEN